MHKFKISLIAVFVFLGITSFSQTVLLSEDFESTTVNFTQSGTINWTQNTAQYISPQNSFSATISSTNDSAALVSNSMNVSSYSNAVIEFYHICKLEFFDNGVLEYSTDNGISWTKVHDSLYLGSGSYGNINTRFNASSYGDWNVLNNALQPDSSWWKKEVFDISSLASGVSQFKIRFKIIEGNSFVSSGVNTWFIDDVKITAANNELIPPSIILATTNPVDTVYTTGPFDVTADIIDSSGVDSAYIIYTVNSGINDTVIMQNTNANSFTAQIPSYGYDNMFTYQVVAVDIYGNKYMMPNSPKVFYNRKPDFIAEIGDGTANSYFSPITITNPSSSVKYSQHISIYTPSEIGTSGIIRKIAWEKTDNAAYSGNDGDLKIYIKHTTLNSVPSANNFNTEISNATLVFEDTNASIGAVNSWYEFDFNQSNFQFNGNDNIMILVDWYRPSATYVNSVEWKVHQNSGQAVTFYGSNSNPTANTETGKRPNIQLHIKETVYDYDIKVSEIISPRGVITPSQNQFKVRITNDGNQTITSAKIGWEVNGVSESQYNWTGNIANNYTTPDINIGSSNNINLGINTFKVWTKLPNDSIDQKPINDTMVSDFYLCNTVLNGDYTLGKQNSDFPDFQTLIPVLHNCGISGNTTIKIESGDYNENIELGDSIPGLTATNYITFISKTANKNDVKINGKLTLNGTDNIKLKNICFINNNTVLELNDSIYNFYADSCSFIGPVSDGTSYTHTILANNGFKYNFSITNSLIQNGYYSMDYAGSYSNYDTIFNFSNNSLNGFYRHGLNLAYLSDFQINGNTVEAVQNSSAPNFVPFNLSNCSYTGEISINKINLDVSNACYGLYLSNCSNLSSAPIKITNNMISINGSSSSASVRAMYISSSSTINIYNNSIQNSIISSGTEALYVTGSTSRINLKGNILSHSGGGYALELSSSVVPSTTLQSCDYNAYYSAGTHYAKISGTTVNTSGGISALQSQTGLDANSLFTNPQFYSLSNLHSYSPAIDSSGTPISTVINDFDGEIRNSTNPDIGADEFDVLPNDAALIEIITPYQSMTEGTAVNTEFAIGNFGTDTIFALDIVYQLNGNSPVSSSWSGILAPGVIDTLSAASITIPPANYQIKAYTQFAADTFNSNDSAEVTLYGLPLNDINLISLLSPSDGCQLDSNEAFVLELSNEGQNNINGGFSLSYKISGSSNIITEQFNDTIFAGDTTQIAFNTNVNMSVVNDSNFIFNIWSTLNGDPIAINDSLSASVYSQSKLESPIVSDTTINYGDSVSLLASSIYPLEWYADSTSSIIIDNDSSFTSPQLFDTISYYVRANTDIPEINAQLGTGNLTTGSTSNVGPYGPGSFGGTKQQYIYKASELAAAGLSAGPIKSISFFLDNALYASTKNNVTVSIGNVGNNTATTAFITGLTQIYYGNIAIDYGWNEHTLQTPFSWDGVSNIVVEICHTNNGGFGGNPPIRYTTTNFISVTAVGGFFQGCPSTTGQTFNTRPNCLFKTFSQPGCSSDRVPVTVNVPRPQYDLRISEFIKPETTACGNANKAITLGVHNNGTDTMPAGFSLTYRINNSSYNTPEVVNTHILPNDTLIYTFSTLANMPSNSYNPVSYQITSKIISNLDSYSGNDTLISDSIEAHYTPSNPVVSDMTVNYADSASLTASSVDSMFWYSDSLANYLIGKGNPYLTNPVYDTTVFYAEARYSTGNSRYDIGTGTNLNTTSSGPSPYGADGAGAKHQFLIKASELSAFGLSQGYIDTIAFNTTSSVTTPLEDYAILMKSVNMDSLSEFVDINDTVYSNSAYVINFGWNYHKLQNRFYWDGSSDIVIETRFLNSADMNFIPVYNTSTSFLSSINSYSYSYNNWTPEDSIVSEYHYKRPNIRLSIENVGRCGSDLMPLTVNVQNIPTEDIGITEIIAPNSASSQINEDVIVILKNYGTNTLTSADIAWSENSNIQTTYNWTGNLMSGDVDTVTIASHLFAGGSTDLKVWALNPNNLTDNYAINDTVFKQINVCMSGTYYIGPSFRYNTINQAIDDMEINGICGNVVFEIDSGDYVEQVEIENISGNNANSSITFKSLHNDSSSVHIKYSTQQTSNYVIKIADAQNINLNKISISSLGNLFANAVLIGDNVDSVIISNSIITSSLNSLPGAVASNIRLDGADNTGSIYIENNVFNNGNDVIYISGTYSQDVNNINIINNTLIDFQNKGLELRYINGLEVRNNVIDSDAGSQLYGIYTYRVDNAGEITNNIIKLFNNNSFAFGIYYNYSEAVASDYTLIANNMISVGGDYLSYRKGVYFSTSKYLKFYNNSIYVSEGTSGNRGLQVSNGLNQKFLNNSIYCKYGYVVYTNSTSSISTFDYNNLYTNSSNNDFAYWGTHCSSLSALKSADINSNQNSISANPWYVSWDDLHCQAGLNNGSGTPLTIVPADIDNQARDANNPDIGADEFTTPAVDIAANNILYPSSSECYYSASDSIKVKLTNIGSNNLDFSTSNLNVKAIIQGVNPDTIIHIINSGTLASLNDTIVLINNVDLSVNGDYKIEVIADINGDANAFNDSISNNKFNSLMPINTFPYSETFENFDDFTFKHEVGLNSAISISADASNNSNYGLMFTGGTYANYTNSSSVVGAFSNTSHIAKAYTCQVDASNLNALNIKFDLRQTMSDASLPNNSWFRLMITDTNGVSHYAKNTNGDSTFQPQTNYDPFVTQVFELSDFTGQNISISLESACKYDINNSGGFNSDNAYVDNIEIWIPSQTDVGAEHILGFNKNFYKVGTNHSVEFEARNYGTDTIYSIPAAYSYNGNIVRDTFATTLYPSQTQTFTFNQNINIAPYDNNLCVFIEIAVDSILGNDTVCYYLKGLNQYSPDYFTDFENANESWFGTGNYGHWELGSPNGQNIDIAYSGNNAYMTDLDNNYNSSTYEYLYSPYFKIASNDTAYIEFYQYMDVNVDNAYGLLQYSFDGINWTTLGSANMQGSTNWYTTSTTGIEYWSAFTNAYIQSSAPLDPSVFNINQTFQLRFMFSSLSSNQTADGWAIDDFKLHIPQLSKDVELISISNPDSSTVTGDSISVVVSISNNGIDTVYNLPVSYRIGNFNTTSETISIAIAPNDTISYTFNSKYLAKNSNYSFCAFVDLAGDLQSNNDSVCKVILSTAANHDLSLSKIISPYPSASISGQSVKIRIKNKGLNTESNFDVEYYIDGIGSSTVETVSQSITPGDSLDYTFTTQFNPPIGSFNFCTKVNLSSDQYNLNDSKCEIVTGTSISDAELYGISLEQNTPNPFSYKTTFEIGILKPSKAIFVVTNSYGKRVHIEEINLKQGKNVFIRDFNNLAEGVYFYSIRVDGLILSKKMLIIK